MRGKNAVVKGDNMGKYFGTDGFRGEANEGLTAMHAFKVGRFLGWYYGRYHKCSVVIGKDTRRSSYMFEDALSSGLTSVGADVYLLHVTTTPSVSYVAKTEDFDCGIMISASHNPYYDNGIKLINSDGEKMEQSVIDELEEYIDGDFDLVPYATRDHIGRTIDYFAGRNRYMGYLMTLAKNSFKNVKVGLDCSNGSASSIAKSVFDALGAETYVINDKPNGTNINMDCGSTHIDALQKYVKENNLDIGFAYDGDADRCMCVDDKGDIVNGDLILYVCGVYLKQNGELTNNTIVTTVMSNIGLYKALDAVGINYEKTNVGDKYVYECMRKNGHRLGGEQSGHIIFGKYATTGDGILTSIKLMEVMLSTKRRMSELISPVTIYPQCLINVNVTDKKSVMEDMDIKNAIEDVEQKLGDDGRILVRESGTEPVIRVMVEAKTNESARQCAKSVADMMQKKGYAV